MQSEGYGFESRPVHKVSTMDTLEEQQAKEETVRGFMHNQYSGSPIQAVWQGKCVSTMQKNSSQGSLSLLVGGSM